MQPSLLLGTYRDSLQQGLLLSGRLERLTFVGMVAMLVWHAGQMRDQVASESSRFGHYKTFAMCHALRAVSMEGVCSPQMQLQKRHSLT